MADKRIKDLASISLPMPSDTSFGVQRTGESINEQVTLANLATQIDHNALNNYEAARHVDHGTVSITGTNSIAGGGDISTSRTLELVNDLASPGLSKFYGTDGAGTKGWYTASGVTLLGGDGITITGGDTINLGGTFAADVLISGALNQDFNIGTIDGNIGLTLITSGAKTLSLAVSVANSWRITDTANSVGLSYASAVYASALDTWIPHKLYVDTADENLDARVTVLEGGGASGWATSGITNLSTGAVQIVSPVGGANSIDLVQGAVLDVYTRVQLNSTNLNLRHRHALSAIDQRILLNDTGIVISTSDAVDFDVALTLDGAGLDLTIEGITLLEATDDTFTIAYDVADHGMVVSSAYGDGYAGIYGGGGAVGDFLASVYTANLGGGVSATVTVSDTVAGYPIYSLRASSSEIEMRAQPTGGTFQLISVDGSQMLISDTVNSKGLVYAADYSTAGIADDRWIPDYKAVTDYADSIVTPATAYWKTSGTTTLTNNITIDQDTNTADILFQILTSAGPFPPAEDLSLALSYSNKEILMRYEYQSVLRTEFKFNNNWIYLLAQDSTATRGALFTISEPTVSTSAFAQSFYNVEADDDTNMQAFNWVRTKAGHSASNGIGITQNWYVQNDNIAEDIVRTATYEVTLQDVTKNAEDGEINWQVITGGSLVDVVSLDGTKGFLYAADYSAGFSANSLINKGYADGAYWKTNGNTQTAGTVSIRVADNGYLNIRSLSHADTSLNITHVSATGRSYLDIRGKGDGGEAYLVFDLDNGITLGPGVYFRDTRTVPKGMFYLSNYDTGGIATHGDDWIPSYRAVKAYADSVVEYIVINSAGTLPTATGDDSIAIGEGADATGNQSVAIGSGADVATLRARSVVIGYFCFADTSGAAMVAIGDSAWAQGGSSIAIGDDPDAFGLNSIAIGTDAHAKASIAQISIGQLAGNSTGGTFGDYAISIGTASNQGATLTIGENSIALGRSTRTSGIGGMAFGRFSYASAQGAIMMGYHTSAQTNSLANSFELAWDGVSQFKVGATIGVKVITNTLDANITSAVEGSLYYKTDTDELRIYDGAAWSAVGGGGDPYYVSNSSGTLPVATANNALAMGQAASAGAVASIAIGENAAASAAAAQSISIGYNSDVTATNSIAIGNNAQATTATAGTGNIAIGFDTDALKTVSIAIGYSTQAQNDRDVAIGYAAVASGGNSLALGESTDATAASAVAIGTGAQAGTVGAIAIGGSATITGGSYAITIGQGTSSTGTQTIVMGNGAIGNSDYAIAIGADAGDNGAGTDGVSSISIGNQANSVSTQNIGIDSIAIGHTSGSRTDNSIAIGLNALADTGDNAIAIGSNTDANGAGAVAIGQTAQANAANSMALGPSATADQSGAIAIGMGTVQAKASNAISIGNGAGLLAGGTYGNSAITIGADANKDLTTLNIGASSVTIGASAAGRNTGAVSIGFGAGATSGTIGTYGVSIGYNANQGSNDIGANSISIGYSTETVGQSSIAIGNISFAYALDAIAIGTSATAQSYGVSIGSSSDVTASQGVAVGYFAQSTAIQAVAVGDQSKAQANYAVSLGSLAGSTSGTMGAYTISIGYDANGNGALDSGASSIAIGPLSYSQGAQAIAIGVSTAATGGNSIGIGNAAKSTNTGSVAIGNATEANGSHSIAVGYQSGLNTDGVDGNYSITIGYNSNSTASQNIGSDAIALGRTVNTISNDAIAMGLLASVSAVGGQAIGRGTEATSQGAMMYGYASGVTITNARTDSFALGWDETIPSLWIEKYATTTTGVSGTSFMDIPLDASSTYTIEVLVTGGESDASGTMFGSFRLTGGFYRIGAGNVVAMGSVPTGAASALVSAEGVVSSAAAGAEAIDAALSVSTTNVRITVTGPVTTTNMNWRAVVKLTKVASATS